MVSSLLCLVAGLLVPSLAVAAGEPQVDGVHHDGQPIRSSNGAPEQEDGLVNLLMTGRTLAPNERDQDNAYPPTTAPFDSNHDLDRDLESPAGPYKDQQLTGNTTLDMDDSANGQPPLFYATCECTKGGKCIGCPGVDDYVVNCKDAAKDCYPRCRCEKGKCTECRGIVDGKFDCKNPDRDCAPICQCANGICVGCPGVAATKLAGGKVQCTSEDFCYPECTCLEGLCIHCIGIQAYESYTKKPCKCASDCKRLPATTKKPTG